MWTVIIMFFLFWKKKSSNNEMSEFLKNWTWPLCLIDRKWRFLGTFAGYAREEIGCCRSCRVIWKGLTSSPPRNEDKNMLFVLSISLVWPRSYRAKCVRANSTVITLIWISHNFKIIWKSHKFYRHFQIQMFHVVSLNCIKIDERIMLHCCRWPAKVCHILGPRHPVMYMEWRSGCCSVSRKGWFGYSIF